VSFRPQISRMSNLRQSRPYNQHVHWELFDGVPATELQPVLEMARRRTFRRGEVVFHQGDPADSLHLVVRGRFAIARRTAIGEDTLLAICSSGDVFGELALVSGRERSATVSALEAGETLCVYRVDFDELRSRHSSVDRVLVTLLAGQLQRMNELLSEAFYENARRRVLRRLLELGRFDAETGEEVVRITQEQLGALAGASRATVASVLAAERARGSIEVKRGMTILLDRNALTRRAGLPLAPELPARP
jgi:CRP/FNR family transcriptional regulator, cyclic AMP receptor protein